MLSIMGETIATIEVAIVLIKHGLLVRFFYPDWCWPVEASFVWLATVRRQSSDFSAIYSTWCLP